MSILDIKTEDFLAWKPTVPVSGNIIRLNNPQVIRMQNIDVLFESETHNLTDTKVLVSILKNWAPHEYTQGHVARLLNGKACGYDHPHATQWDAYGILLKYSDSIEQADRIANFMEQHKGIKPLSLPTFSDTATFEEVMLIFRDTTGFLAELSQREITLKEILS